MFMYFLAIEAQAALFSMSTFLLYHTGIDRLSCRDIFDGIRSSTVTWSCSCLRKGIIFVTSSSKPEEK